MTSSSSATCSSEECSPSAPMSIDLASRKSTNPTFAQKIFVRATLHQLSLEGSKRRSDFGVQQYLATLASQDDLASESSESTERSFFADNVALNPSIMQSLERARRDLGQIIKDRKTLVKRHRRRMRDSASDRLATSVTALIWKHSDCCSQSSDLLQVLVHILHCNITLVNSKI